MRGRDKFGREFFTLLAKKFVVNNEGNKERQGRIAQTFFQRSSDSTQEWSDASCRGGYDIIPIGGYITNDWYPENSLIRQNLKELISKGTATFREFAGMNRNMELELFPRISGLATVFTLANRKRTREYMQSEGLDLSEMSNFDENLLTTPYVFNPSSTSEATTSTLEGSTCISGVEKSTETQPNGEKITRLLNQLSSTHSCGKKRRLKNELRKLGHN